MVTSDGSQMNLQRKLEDFFFHKLPTLLILLKQFANVVEVISEWLEHATLNEKSTYFQRIGWQQRVKMSTILIPSSLQVYETVN